MDDKLSVCNSNASSETVSLHSLVNDVKKKNYIEKPDFMSLSSCISNQCRQLIQNINRNDELCKKYFTTSKNLENELEQFSLASVKHRLEETKIRSVIKELEKKLKSSLLRNQVISQEMSTLKKEEIVIREALCLAKRYYSSVWDMHINIEDSREDQFTCIINFKFDCGMYPIKFMVDRKKQGIIGWCGQSLLTAEQENQMKEKYSGTEHYFPQVLSELRLLALNKIKMS